MRLVTDSTTNVCWTVGAAAGLGLKLSIAIKGEFMLKPDSPLIRSPKPPECSGDRLAETESGPPALVYPSDFALFKPRADVLLVGSAHAPAGTPVSQLDVSLRVGNLKKSLFVIGDRYWQGRF